MKQKKKWFNKIAGILFLLAVVPARCLNASDAAADFVPNEVLIVVKESEKAQMRSRSGEYFLEEEKEAYGIEELERKAFPIGREESRRKSRSGTAEDDTQFVYYKATLKENTVLETAAALSGLENVAAAEPNYRYGAEEITVPDEESDPLYGEQWYLENLEARKVWETLASQGKAPGEGVVVALLDTGVNASHEDLKENLWVNEAERFGVPGEDDDGNGLTDDIYGYNFVSGNGNISDTSGHGTQMAGILSMVPFNGAGGAGVSWGAKLMPVKVGSGGSFDTDTVVEGIAYAVDQGADVINMSFGGGADSWILRTALQEAASHCILVAAAGNEGLPTANDSFSSSRKTKDVYPAGYSCVIGVMSQDMDGSLSDFSNWDSGGSGASYEAAAPGNGLYTTTYRGGYGTSRGTSGAAAAVSGAAAFLRGIYADREKYPAPVLQRMLLDALKERTFEKSSDGMTVTCRELKLGDLLEYAVQDEALADTVPPEGQDMTEGVYFLHDTIPFQVCAEDNREVKEVFLYYRSSRSRPYTRQKMELTGVGRYEVKIAADFERAGNVEYFFEISDGVFYTYIGSQASPHTLFVYQCRIGDVSFGEITDCIWDGKPQTPKISARDGARELEEGQDFAVSYENHEKPGNAGIRIIGLGDYYGSTYLNFTIKEEKETSRFPVGTKEPNFSERGRTPESPGKKRPGKVKGMRLVKTKAGIRKVRWKKPSGDVTGYYLYGAKRKTGRYVKIAGTKKTEIRLTGKQRKRYRYVKAAAYRRVGKKNLTGAKSGAVKIR